MGLTSYVHLLPFAASFVYRQIRSCDRLTLAYVALRSQGRLQPFWPRNRALSALRNTSGAILVRVAVRMPAAYSTALCEKVITNYWGMLQSYAKVVEDLVVLVNLCRAVTHRWHASEQGLLPS